MCRLCLAPLPISWSAILLHLLTSQLHSSFRFSTTSPFLQPILPSLRFSTTCRSGPRARFWRVGPVSSTRVSIYIYIPRYRRGALGIDSHLKNRSESRAQRVPSRPQSESSVRPFLPTMCRKFRLSQLGKPIIHRKARFHSALATYTL